MMLGYRSLFTINVSSREAVDAVFGHAFEWLSTKYDRFNASSIHSGSKIEIGTVATLTRHDVTDSQGRKFSRLILAETKPGEKWVTSITVGNAQTGGSRPWVLIEVEAPTDGTAQQGRWTGAPRLVRALLDNYECFDNGVRLTTRPIIVRAQQVDELVRLLKRPGRRALSFIAGSSEQLPIKQWADLIEQLLGQSIGQASGYVLDPSATILFNKLIGIGFTVEPGMLRTFLPGLNTSDPAESLRHRFVTASSIASQHPARLRKSLSYRARELANIQLLPSIVRLASRNLEDADFQLPPIDSELDAHEYRSEFQNTSQNSSNHEPDILLPEAQIQAPDRPTASQDINPKAESSKFTHTLFSIVANATGGSKVGAPEIDELRRIVERGLASIAIEEKWRHHLQEKQDELEAAQTEAAQLRELTEDLQLDAAELWEDYVASTEGSNDRLKTVNHLRGILVKSNLGDQAWTQPVVQPPNLVTAPEGFNDLIGKIGQLPNISYTGDPAITADLDQFDVLSDWCKKTWHILLALNDYATHRRTQSIPMGVQGFLENTPSGSYSYPPGRHARDESDSVKNNPKFRQPRMLPCPSEVNVAGMTFMGAHFKIAKHGLISPRLHYYDATASGGLIIVGYIGRHLPNTMTN